MRILKGNFFKRYKSKFGNFKLEPDEGWKISQCYLDFESKLLIVSESDCNEENWTDTGFDGRIIPTKEYVIDTKTLEILNHEQWCKYFKYEPTEILSDDGRYKLIVERIYDPERNSDFINEHLIEINSGKVVGNSYRVAFLETQQDNILQQKINREKEENERQLKIDAMPDLEEYHSSIIKKLRNGQVIIYFTSNECGYEVKYLDGSYLLRKSDKQFSNENNIKDTGFKTIKVYPSLDIFWKDFMVAKDWMEAFTPYKSTRANLFETALQKFVVTSGNKLRLLQEFTDDEYLKLVTWERAVCSKTTRPDEFRQGCPNCGTDVRFNPRYPKYICSKCANKTIVDENGVELKFSNIGFSGGLRISYYKDGEKFNEETDKVEKICFLDGKQYIATEARFGGIVIQRP